MRSGVFIILIILFGCQLVNTDVVDHPLEGTYLRMSVPDSVNSPTYLSIRYIDVQTIEIAYRGDQKDGAELDILKDDTHSLFWTNGCEIFVFEQNQPSLWDHFTLKHFDCGEFIEVQYRRHSFSSDFSPNATVLGAEGN